MIQLALLANLLVVVLAATTKQTTGGTEDRFPVILTSCYNTAQEKQKCEAISNETAHENRIKLNCIENKSGPEACFDLYKRNVVDLISPDLPTALTRIRKNQVHPVLQQFENNGNDIGVAIVKKSSPVKTWGDFFLSTICQNNQIDYFLIDALDQILINIMGNDTCPYFGHFALSLFRIPEVSNNPLECLATNKGEVAFMDYGSAKQIFAEGKYKTTDFELLCKEGGRKPINQYATCNVGVAAQKAMSSTLLTQKTREHMLEELAIGGLYMAKHVMHFEALCAYQKKTSKPAPPKPTGKHGAKLQAHNTKLRQQTPTMISAAFTEMKPQHLQIQKNTL